MEKHREQILANIIKQFQKLGATKEKCDNISQIILRIKGVNACTLVEFGKDKNDKQGGIMINILPEYSYIGSRAMEHLAFDDVVFLDTLVLINFTNKIRFYSYFHGQIGILFLESSFGKQLIDNALQFNRK